MRNAFFWEKEIQIFLVTLMRIYASLLEDFNIISPAMISHFRLAGTPDKWYHSLSGTIFYCPFSKKLRLTLRLRKTRICVQKACPLAKAVTSEQLKTRDNLRSFKTNQSSVAALMAILWLFEDQKSGAESKG